jgi:hypothetical protein
VTSFGGRGKDSGSGTCFFKCLGQSLFIYAEGRLQNEGPSMTKHRSSDEFYS